MMDAAVVGGGVSGLAVASSLLELGMDPSRLVVLEKGSRPGGNVSTLQEDGFTIERGPNGFLDNAPATLALASRLGLDDQILPSNEAANDRFIYRAGRLRRIEAHPMRFIGSGILPLHGALRVALEPFIAQGGSPEETVYDFARRRIGASAARILVDAMVSGVFAGRADRLELSSAFPKMYAMEARYGSLVKAMMAKRKERRGAGGPAGPGGRLTSFLGGFETLPAALARRVGESLRCNAAVTRVLRVQDRFEVHTAAGESIPARTVVFACPAKDAAFAISSLDEPLAAELSALTYPPLAVVATAFDPGAVDPTPSGFGFLVPRGEGLRILGCLWTSSIWTHRVPDGSVLLRTMVGGSHDPKSAELSDDELLSLVLAELRTAMGLVAHPSMVRIFRYQRAIAQYEPGHGARLQRMEERLRQYAGVFLSGSSYRGISVNHCIEEAPAIAQKVATLAGLVGEQ